MAPLSPKRGSQVQTGRARTRIKTPDNSLAAEKDLWGDRESQTAKGDFSNLGDSGIQASRMFCFKALRYRPLLDYTFVAKSVYMNP